MLLFVLGLALLPVAALWMWRFHTRVLGSLVPGAGFREVAALADLPVTRTLAESPRVLAGPIVKLVGVTREAASVLVAYRREDHDSAPTAHLSVRTLLLHLDEGSSREMSVLERWRATGAPVVVDADTVASEAAIQHTLTYLTVTLPFVA